MRSFTPLPYLARTTSFSFWRFALVLLGVAIGFNKAEAQSSPGSIAGLALTLTIDSGIAPFSSSGSYRFLGGSDGVYGVVGLSGGVSASYGSFTYFKTGETLGQVNFTDNTSASYVVAVTFNTLTTGSYSIVSPNGATTYQTGHFSVPTGLAPSTIGGYSVTLNVQNGVAPLATHGTAKIVLGSNGTYTLTGSGGVTSSTGTYSYDSPTITGSTLSLTDSVQGSENVTLSWSNSTAGTYVADRSAGVVQAGTFTSALPPAPVITSSTTGSTPVNSSYSYQITASGVVASYNATNLPAGLSVDTSTGVISGTPTQMGTYKIALSAIDGSKSGKGTLTLTVTPLPDTVTLSDLSQVYDGSPEAVTVTTSPSAPTSVTYAGKTTVPTNVGSYVVKATVTGGQYSGSATGTFTITKSPVTITFGANTFGYTGVAERANVTTSPAGQPVTFVYTQNGKTVSPVNVGTYDVVATVNTTNAAGTASGTLTITTGTATVTLTKLIAAYTGKPIPITAVTSPSGLPVSITYDGSPTAPSAIGVYNDVVATVTSPKYTGSATGTFTITPVITTGLATSVTGTTATLNGTLSPRAQVSAASFEYGTTTLYGTTVSGSIGGASATVGTVSAALTNLSGSTIYHYRLDVTSAAGVSVGTDHTFTTGRELGIIKPMVAASAAGAQVSYQVTTSNVAAKAYFQYGTDTTYAGGSTTMQSIAANTVAGVMAEIPGLTSGVTYHYRLVVIYANGTIVDGPDLTFTTLGFDTTTVAATAEVAPDTSGATWLTVGDAALNDADGVAFSATLKPGTGTGTVTSSNLSGIWADDSSGNLHVVARTGDATPGIDDTFISVGTPLYNNDAQVTFEGDVALKSGVATDSNLTGVWQYRNGTGNLVARLGTQVPNFIAGVQFKTFYGIGLTQSAGTVLFTALSGTSTSAGVTTSNNFAIFEGNSMSDLELKLRLGDAVPFNTGGSSGTKTLKVLSYLSEEYLAASQTRNFNASGDLALTGLFTDGTTGIVTVVNGNPSIPLLSGTVAAGFESATWGSFGDPVINNSAHLAFAATLTNGVDGITSTTNTGIFAQDSGGTLQIVAQSGVAGEAPLEVTGQGDDTGSFFEFSDPIYNNKDAVAFAAVLNKEAGLVTATNEIGLYCNSTGSLQLIARAGEQAPGCQAGANFASFTSLVLPDVNGATNKGGLAFIATLTPNKAVGVSEGNNTGIWAVDQTGTLQLIVRVGDLINGKNVSELSFLPYLSGDLGQTRSDAVGTGDLVYRAILSDGTSAIFNVVFP